MDARVLVRFGLPAGIAAVGVVVAAVWSLALGLALIAASVAVFVANLYIRLSIASRGDRDEEAEARRTYSRTGRWPDSRS